MARTALLLRPLVPLLWACSGEDAAKRNTGRRQIFVPETAQASADEKVEQGISLRSDLASRTRSSRS